MIRPRTPSRYPFSVSALARFDLEAFRQIHIGWNSPFFDVLFLVASYCGLGQMPAILVILFALDKRRRAYAVPLAAASLVVALGLVAVVKGAVERDRPSYLAFAHPQEDFWAGSFPSGHTTVGFTVATMLWLLTRGTTDRWMGWIAWPMAVLIGISRVYRGVHWPTDVLAGACLGMLGSCFIWYIWSRVTPRPDPEPAA